MNPKENLLEKAGLTEEQLEKILKMSNQEFEHPYEDREKLIRRMLIESPKEILRIVYQTGFMSGKHKFEGEIKCDCPKCTELKKLVAS